MHEQNAIPAKTEVEQQLERMLANEVFSTKVQQSKVFDCIVRGVLAGKEITEKYIRGKVFSAAPYKPESNIVRRTIDLLRKLVPAYYADQGRNDPVIIKIPHPDPESKIRLKAGEAYAPVFSYNERYVATKEVKLAEYYIKNVGLKDAGTINRHFQKALDIQPQHLGAILGLMEMYCYFSLEIDEQHRIQFLYQARVMLDKANQVAPQFWRTHAGRGLYLTCDANLAGAEREFEVALSLDRPSTQRYRGYIDFLGIAGREEEYMRLSAALLDEQIDVPSAHAKYGIALFDGGRLTEAEAELKQALDMDPGCFPALLGMALLHAKWGSIAEATEYTTRLRALLDDATYETAMEAIRLLLPEQ